MKRLLVPLLAAMTVVVLLAGPAHAATLEEMEQSLLTVFMFLASVLVFIMHAGFALVETGLTRAKNAANITGKNLLTLCIGLGVYFLVGFGVMYGSQVAGLFGTDGFALRSLRAYEPAAGSVAMDFLFQGMFAATAATIISGAVAERIKLSAYLLMAAVVTSIIYPVVGAWTWGGGWLLARGFHDFAGSTIVHVTGGVAALVAAAAVGPRIGRYDDTGRPRAIPGHSTPFAVLGVVLLFFGWFGFNAGSVLAVDGPVIAHVLVATALAGSAGGMAAGWWTKLRRGIFDVAMTANGVLAGLVGVTAGADVVSYAGALAVGALAGLLVTTAVALLERLGIDDAVGAVSVHGACGVLGTLWVGLAHTEAGLLYGGGPRLLTVQAVGVVAVVAWVAASTGLLVALLRSTTGIRVAEHEEIGGLDLHEHGVHGYPELAVGGEMPLP